MSPEILTHTKVVHIPHGYNYQADRTKSGQNYFLKSTTVNISSINYPMIVRFTGKLSKKLKTGPLTKIDENPGPYLDWYANIFTAQRHQYILVTEAQSLLSIVIHGGGVTDDDKFIKQFLSQLHEYLNDTGNRLIYERIIVPQTGVMKLSKTASKSVLGSMNDMINLSKVYLEDEEIGPWELMKKINRTPFKAINYGYPEEIFRKMKLS